MTLTVLVAAATLVSATGATGATPRPQVVGPVHLEDTRALQRLGLDLRINGAPHYVRMPKVAGVVAMDRPGGASGEYRLGQTAADRIVLFGKNSWIYTGSGLSRLGQARFDELLHARPGRSAWYAAADGTVVAEASRGGIAGVGPDAPAGWFIPSISGFPMPPLDVTPEGRVYAVGGFPSILDAGTGDVIARLLTLPISEDPVDVAAAPDGTARVLTTVSVLQGTIRARLHQVGPTGSSAWAPVLAEAGPGDSVSVSRMSVGRDGTTYLGVGRQPAGAGITWRMVAIGADGVTRWETRLGGEPGRPAIDRAGNVWVFVSGVLVTLNPSGREVFRRQIGDRGASGTVAAHADGVLVTTGTTTVRLRARRQGPGPSPAVRLARTTRLQAKPFRCVAPPSGVPKTCLYRLPPPQLEIDAPADGTAVILGPSLREVPVMAGTNRIPLIGFSGIASDCRGGPCTVPPARYDVTVVLRTGGPRREFTRTIRVVPSTGRTVAY
jgi:hypothetical protein